MIVAAAIQFGDLVCFLPPPARHHNVQQAITRLYEGTRSAQAFEVEVQGFLTRAGIFLTRRQAYEYALDCGQIARRQDKPGGYMGNELFTEDLW